MGIYFTPIVMAVIILMLIGFFTAIPWTIHTYRKYGYFSFWTTAVIFSFVFYALAAYFLVILPLPEVRDTCAMQSADTRHYQLIPFYFIYEIFQGGNIIWSQSSTYINFVRHGAFLPAFLNVLILFPLGVYVRYFQRNKMKVRHMFFIGFSVSLFFELTQLTALYGIYTCPYRLFNVDDLILNTLGAVLGFLIAPIILRLFPSQKEVMEKSKEVFKAGFVPPLAQAIAILVDYLLVMLAWKVFAALSTINDPIVNLLFIMIGMFILQFVMPLMTKGNTPGSILLRFELKLEAIVKQKWISALFKRWFALMLPWLAFQIFNLVIQFSEPVFGRPYYVFQIWIQVIMFFFMFLIVFVLGIHILLVLLRKNIHRFYFDTIAGVESYYKQFLRRK